jgi:small subunit ribosomal protein S7
MSRKNRAPQRVIYSDPKYGSLTLSKFINFVMYDGKKAAAEKLIYDALKQIGEKTKEDPIKVFNDAINNIRPNLEVRSRRVGGATYQVPVEVKSKRAQALAIRWLVESARKRKDKHMSDKIFNELFDAYEKKGSAVKKREDVHKMAESNKAFAHFRW